MKGIIITIGILLTIFGAASYAYNSIPFNAAEQTYQVQVLQMIYEKINVLTLVQPTVAAIIAAIGVVLIVYGFSREA